MNEQDQIKLLEGIGDHIWGLRALIRTHVGVGSCIVSSLAISQILSEEFGIVSYPLVARVVGLNPVVGKLYREYGWPIPDDLMKWGNENGGQIAMVGYPNPKNGERLGDFTDHDTWIGHLVSVAMVGEKWFMIDLSADQINKTPGMKVEPFVAVVPLSFINGQESIGLEQEGSTLVYEAYPQDRTYDETGDCLLFRREYQGIIEYFLEYLDRNIFGGNQDG